MITREQVSGKWSLVPGTLPVTYYSKSTSSAGAESWPTTVAIANARKRSLTHEQRVSEQFQPLHNHRNWDLWVEQLGAVEPKPGDYLTEADGTRWNVVSVADNLLQQVKRCVCMKGRS